MPIALREDFDARSMRSAAKRAKVAVQTRRLAALAAIYEGASPGEGRRERRRDAPDRSRLGGEVQRRRARGPDQPQSAWPTLAAQRRASGGARRHGRERADPGCPQRGALASGRSLSVDVRGVPRHHRQTDDEPGIASVGLSQAVRAPQASRPGRGRD